jgi:transcriptional regulator with XRE-family HTH domain
MVAGVYSLVAANATMAGIHARQSYLCMAQPAITKDNRSMRCDNSDVPMIEFSLRLRQTLEAKGMAHAELARRLGIGTSRINHWLNGRFTEPDYEMLLRICDILGTHPNYLLGVSDLLEPEHRDETNRIRALEQEIRELRRALPRKPPR